MKENARVNFEAAATTAMKYNVLLDRNASYPVVFYLSRRGWGISNELARNMGMYYFAYQPCPQGNPGPSGGSRRDMDRQV